MPQAVITLHYDEYVCGTRYAVFVYASNEVGESAPYEYGPTNDFSVPPCLRYCTAAYSCMWGVMAKGLWFEWYKLAPCVCPALLFAASAAG